MSDDLKDETGHIWHQSGVSPGGKPFVQLIIGDKVSAQFTVAECREFALNLLEAAEAAEMDAIVVDFMQTTVGLDQNRAMRVLVDFRTLREQHHKRGGTVTHKSQWVLPDPEMIAPESRAVMDQLTADEITGKEGRKKK